MTQNQEKPVTVLDKPEFLHAFDIIYLIAFIKRELKKNHLHTTSLLEKSGWVIECLFTKSVVVGSSPTAVTKK